MALFHRKRGPEPLDPPPPGEGPDIPIHSEELAAARDQYGQVAEQFRRLRNSIQALNPDGAARSIMLTSAIEGEGKSVATLNLGLTFSELPQVRVLVVDADMRNPSLERYMGLPRRQGLVEVLRGKLSLDHAIRQTAADRMDLIGAGTTLDNPAEILNLDRIRAVLNAMKRRYDYILIDAPPTLAVAHPSVLGTIADGILLVVRLGYTPKGLVEEALQMLEGLGGNVLGTCLTGGKEPDQTGYYRPVSAG